MDFIVEPLSENQNKDELFKPKLASAEIPTSPSIVPPPSPAVEPVRSALRNRKFIWIGGLAVLLVVGLYFLLSGGSFAEARVSLAISAPAEVTSGDLVTYTVTYKNDNKIRLNNAKLTFTYPIDAQSVKDGAISDVHSMTVDLKTLQANTSGQQSFSAYLVGDRGNIKNAQATLTFIPQGINSTIQSQTTHAATITAVPVQVTLVAPPTAVNGQAITYLIDYRNDSSKDLANLRLVLTYPQGFTPSKSNPSPSATFDNQATWDLPKLAAGDAQRLTIQGILRGIEREGKIITLAIQRNVDTSTGGQYIAIEKQSTSTVIATPYLSAFLKLNGSQDYTAHLGDRLQYTATVRNNTNSDLTGLTAQVQLEGSMYDYATVQSSGFFDSRTHTISWTAVAIPELATLRANQSVEMTFSVQLKQNFASGTPGASGSFVKASFHTETPNVPSAIDLASLTADDQLVTRISTVPSFDQRLFIKDAQWGSVGPYPPKVDQKTVFTVRWSLTNPSNALENVKITASLPPGVTWENKVRTSNNLPAPVVNTQLGTVSWNVGSIPGGTGVATPPYEADFQISITPSVNQVGSSVVLIKNISMTGTDSATKEQLTRAVSDASTSNISDSSAGGNVQQ